MKKKINLNEFFEYVSFNILSMLSLSIYILIDTYFVADKLGVTGLAALNLAIPFFSFMAGLGLMIGIGGSINYTIERSRTSQLKANQIFTESIKLGAVTSAVFFLIGLFLTENIVGLFDVELETAVQAKVYIKWMLLFSPGFIFNHIISNFVKNDDNPKLTMIALVVGSIFNASFDYILMYKYNMGMLGAVIATVLSPITSLIILTAHFKYGNLKLIKEKLRIKERLQIIEMGIPILINDISRGIVVILFNVLALRLEGDVGIASFGILANLSMFFLSIYIGIGQGIQPLVSRYYAKKDTDSIKTILRYGVITSVIYFLISYCIVYFGAEKITSIFNGDNNPQMAVMGVRGLKIYFSGALFAGLNIILVLFFSSIRLSKIARIITILKGVVLIAIMAYLLSYLYGIDGLWLSYPVTEFITLLFSIFSYKRIIDSNQLLMIV